MCSTTDVSELNVKTTSPGSAGTDRYRRAIRAAVRGLWTGVLNYSLFWDAMSAAIRNGLTTAWHAGMKDCGVNPDEMTEQERIALLKRITYEHQWINRFAIAIEQGSKANGGKLTPLYSRAEVWIGRWEGVKSEARVMACADQKLEWVLGPTEESCPSCSKLAGQVRRASFWKEKGILPRIHGAWWLACHGFRCQCSLEPTDKPMSRGPLPKLP